MAPEHPTPAATPRSRAGSPTLTRSAIVAATRDLIVAEGLEAVTLRRIAAALGVTAPALYAHVTDKRDLLQAVAEVEFSALTSRFESAGSDDPVERMRELGRAYILHARAQPELFRVMFLFPPDLGIDAGTAGVEIAAATKAFTVPAAAASQAVEAGRLALADPLLVSLVTWCAFHGVSTVLQMGFAFPDELQEQLVDAVIDTTIKGLLA